MALAYVGGQVGQFAGTTTPQTINFALTGGLAAAPEAGDLVIIGYGVGSTVDRSLAIRNTSAVDYTLAGSELTISDTFDANLRVAYRFMPATPETQFVLTETVSGGTGNNADAGAYSVHVFRFVDTSTPLDVAVVTAAVASTRLVNPVAITPVTAGAWIVVFGTAACGTGGNYTVPLYLIDFRVTTQSDTNDVNYGSGWRPWTMGAYDPPVWAGGGTDSTNDSYCAITLALRPAAEPSPGGGGGMRLAGRGGLAS